jgi:putative thioredoxin
VHDAEPGRTEARSAIARLELAQRAGATDIASLEARVIADPTNVDAVLALADAEMQRGNRSGALNRLVELVRATTGDDRERVRKHLLGLLETLPVDDPNALSARKALAAALF